MASMKLVFEKGPRNGEIRTYNPRSKVRIGRVVKGNNLNIKDDAISSQHLTIHFDSGSGKWVITDLHSSNGTHLNSSKLKPFSPFQLSNGDEIKIGDSTSIRVEIVDVTKKPKVCPNLVEVGSVRVNEVENLKKESDETLIPNVEERIVTRSTRNSKRARYEFLSLEKVIPARKTRGIKNKAEVENSENAIDNTIGMDVSQSEVPEEPIGDTLRQYPLVDEVIEGVIDEREKEPICNTIQETPTEVMLNIDVSEAGDVSEEVDVKEHPCEEAFKGENDNGVSASHVGQGASERPENDMVLEVEEIDEESDIEIDEGEKEHKFETFPDLEKMTYGDWFDYLKVSLPMQICAARDETIRHMR